MIWGMKILRTPGERFRDLPGFPFAPHDTEVPDGDGRGERFARIVADFVKSSPVGA